MHRPWASFAKATLFFSFFTFAGTTFGQSAPDFEIPSQRKQLAPAESFERETPVVRSVEKSGDYYLVDGKPVELRRAADELAVVYGSQIGLKELESIVSVELESIGFFAPGNLEVIRQARTTKSAKLAKAADLAAALEKNPSAAAETFPVLVAADGVRMIPTRSLLVCVEAGVSEAVLNDLLDGGGVVAEKRPAEDLDVYTVSLRQGIDPLKASRDLAALSQVQWAEPNFVREIRKFFTPNDPLFSEQQTLHNTGGNGRLADADVDAVEAWDITRGDSSIVVAIIDDGVDTAHPDMNIAADGYDFHNDDADPNPSGTQGHGTGCAGVTAAIGNNGSLVSGIAPNSQILPIKISGDVFSSSQIIGDAMRYAADRADVLSNSWGGGSPSSFINSAIDYANAFGRNGLGSPVFFATGNSASGWYRGGGRIRLNTSGLNGNYFFGFNFIKDGSIDFGLDAALVDNVCLIEADGYTHRWREDFEGTFPPAGWTTDGDAGWIQTSSDALQSTGGTQSAKSGQITHSQTSRLVTPLQTVNGTETFAFSLYNSMEDVYDLLYVDIYDNQGAYLGSYGPFTGVPEITPLTSYPANYSGAIAVGTASDNDRRADYSQYGADLDFLAPSNGGWNDVTTLDPTGSVGWTDNGVKKSFGGTSSACPLAAGIAALMLSMDDTLTASEVRDVMRKGCDKVGPFAYTGGIADAGGRNDEYGYGRLNAKTILDSLDNDYDGRPLGDFDNDQCTDLNDFLFLLDNWQQNVGGAMMDVNDFLALLDNWQTGAGC